MAGYDKWICKDNGDGTKTWERKTFRIATEGELSQEKKVKKAWTEAGLTYFLQTLEAGVDRCEYIYLPETGDEIITIFYKGGGYHEVNVTADSKVGAIYDIMRANIW